MIQWYNGSENLVNDTQSKDYFDALYQLYDIIGDTDAVAHYCYDGFD